MAARELAYTLDDGTEVWFETDLDPDWYEVDSGKVVGALKEAAGTAIEGASAVLDRVREQLRGRSPQEIELKFGLKVTGKVDWLIAKASSEANFEVTLRWRSVESEPRPASVS